MNRETSETEALLKAKGRDEPRPETPAPVFWCHSVAFTRIRTTLLAAAVVALGVEIMHTFRTFLSKSTPSGGSSIALGIAFTNDYPAISSTLEYPWDIIVEPAIDTTLSLSGVLSSVATDCTWTIEASAITSGDGASPETYERSGCSSFAYSFTSVSTLYSVRVKVNGVTVATSVMCKYGEARAACSVQLLRLFRACHRYGAVSSPCLLRLPGLAALGLQCGVRFAP